MKVLWITNVLLPEVSAALTGDGSIKMSGGWLSAMANALVIENDVDLYVATVCDQFDKVKRIDGEKIHYYLLPRRTKHNRYDKKHEIDWLEIKKDVDPDIVHIHGTEFPYGLSYVNACGTDNVIVSIQGMTSEIVKYCKGGLSNWDILRNITIRDLLLSDSIFSEYRQMKISGNNEIELLKKVKYVIGRTNWDRIHSLSINKTIKYFHNEELLRDPFYDGQWDSKTCIPHSIFVSQLHCPLKGFHFLLPALALLKKDYPDICVYVSGWNIFKGTSFWDSVKQTGYAKYLNRLIKKLDLTYNIKMLGFLDADGIKKQLLKSNVYVCPSTIENSPNSLCEAQILGVPCVASYVGGIPDFMSEASHFMYRFDDWRYLTYLIGSVFKGEYDKSISLRQVALKRHARIDNARLLTNIYKSVLENE